MLLFNDDKSVKRLKEVRHQEGEDLAQILATRYGLPYADLSLVTINPNIVRLLAEKDARGAQVIVFGIDGKALSLGILTPQNPKVALVTEELTRKGYTVSQSMVSQDALTLGWEVYNEVSNAVAETAGVISVSEDTFNKYLQDIKSTFDIKALVDGALHSGNLHATSTIAEIILAGAVATGVSDVHFEAEKENARLRYRVDGVLQDILEFTTLDYKRLLSRLKLLSGVKLNMVHEAQDGRFTIRLQGLDVEVRASFLPSSYMDAVVLRILNPKSISVPMEDLGMDEHLLKIVENEIERPNGLILTTGPTGSGKTTTLYAALKKLRSPQIKIITIEDPIEYHLEGISQTQIDNKGSGYRFSDGLRAAVRQDPDVVMVGEIRDEETAGVAIDAALTGHLVLSTLHTNSAAGAIPRLIDLGVNPKIIGSALNITLAQRLVRKLCQFCKESYEPTGKDKQIIDTYLPDIQTMREIEYPKVLYRPIGCDKCTMTGYKGRISVYEGILMDARVEDVIRSNPSEREIREAAKPQKILDMQQDAIVKIIKGITSFEEVSRIIGLEKLR